MKGGVYWREPRRWGNVVEHILHNDEVVVQYEIMILGAMGIQADYIGIAHVIQTSEQLYSL